MLHPRVISGLCFALFGLAACSAGATSQASGDDGVSPLPTVGLSSETGSERISGGADVRSTPTDEIDSIVMIGDSITVGAMPYLDDQFADLGIDDVTISAQENKRVDVSRDGNESGSSIAEFIAAGRDESPGSTLWIVALGTNDIGNTENIDDIQAMLDTVLDPIPDAAPLIWINTYVAGKREASADLNTAIDRSIEERGNAMVGRWNEVALTDGVLSGDGVHPSDDGSEAFASLVTATVDDFLA